MAVLPLPLPPNTAARALLHHLLEHGDIVGRDTAGHTIIQLSVNDHVLDILMTFDAEAADLEDGGDDEPDADDGEGGPPVVVELVRPKVTKRGRPAALTRTPRARPAGSSGWRSDNQLGQRAMRQATTTS